MNLPTLPWRPAPVSISNSFSFHASNPPSISITGNDRAANTAHALAARRGLAAEAVFARAAIASTARAETLDLEAFARLARAFA